MIRPHHVFFKSGTGFIIIIIIIWQYQCSRLVKIYFPSKHHIRSSWSWWQNFALLLHQSINFYRQRPISEHRIVFINDVVFDQSPDDIGGDVQILKKSIVILQKLRRFLSRMNRLMHASWQTSLFSGSLRTLKNISMTSCEQLSSFIARMITANVFEYIEACLSALWMFNAINVPPTLRRDWGRSEVNDVSCCLWWGLESACWK